MTKISKIKAEELKKSLDQNAGQVVDVREAVEFSGEKIKGSRNVPLSELHKTKAEIQKDKTVYLLCRSGNRACQAAEQLQKDGYENVVVIEGGLEACKRSGIPVESGPSKVWSLERQVRFAAGSFVLAGIILAWFFHPAFLGLSVFIASGLIFSAVTDTCGMAMMLAKMPWNRTGK